MHTFDHPVSNLIVLKLGYMAFKGASCTQPQQGAVCVAHGLPLVSTSCVQQFFSPPGSFWQLEPPHLPQLAGQQAVEASPPKFKIPLALSHTAFVMYFGPGGEGGGVGPGGGGVGPGGGGVGPGGGGGQN